MRIFKTKVFSRYAAKEGIDDRSLNEAIKRVEKGLIDAELGGNLIKIRIARKGEGRSSGYRTLIAYKKNDKAVFLYGFAKNERDNIDSDELTSLKEIASKLIKSKDQEINNALSKGELKEIDYEEKAKQINKSNS